MTFLYILCKFTTPYTKQLGQQVFLVSNVFDFGSVCIDFTTWTPQLWLSNADGKVLDFRCLFIKEAQPELGAWASADLVLEAPRDQVKVELHSGWRIP